MKKSIFTIGIIASIFSVVLISCEEDIEELLNITFETFLTESIVIHVDQTSGTAANFNKTIVIDLDNPDTTDYLDLIEDLSITSLTYRIIDFTGDPAGTIDAEFIVNGVSLATNDIVVKTEADNGTVYEITDTALLNQIATDLKNNLQVSAEYTGTALCDADVMDFKIEVTVGVEITAEAL